MIVITGTQRSGTSFMAKYFKACGHDVGTDFWDSRINGGLENPDVCNHFRNYLNDNNFPFSKYWHLIGNTEFKDFKSLQLSIIKFSYLLMMPRLIDEWVRVRGNQDKFIIMNRDPYKVYTSKNSRQEFSKEDYFELNQTPEQLKDNYTQSILKLDTYGIDYIIIDFPLKTTPLLIKNLMDFTGLKISYQTLITLYNKNKITVL